MSTETVAQTNEIILRPDENVAFSNITSTGFNYMYLSLSGLFLSSLRPLLCGTGSWLGADVNARAPTSK